MKPKDFLPLKLKNVDVKFGEICALNDVSLTIDSNGISAIIGSNGSGKTLLLRCCAALIKPYKGSLHWKHSPTPPQLTFVPQKPVLLDRSVRDNIRLPLQHNVDNSIDNSVDDNIHQRTEEALKWANINSLALQPALTLSTGEQQLLALARAWALKPCILLLDEPTANLDPSRSEQINTLIQELSLSCKIIMSTHDIQQAQMLANDIILLNKGKVIEHTQSDIFFNSSTHENFLSTLF